MEELLAPLINNKDDVTDDVSETNDQTGNYVDGAENPGASEAEEENDGDAGNQVTDAQNSEKNVNETGKDGDGAKTMDPPTTKYQNEKGTGNYDDGAETSDPPKILDAQVDKELIEAVTEITEKYDDGGKKSGWSKSPITKEKEYSCR